MRPRLAAVILATTATLALAACSSDSKDTTVPTTPPSASSSDPAPAGGLPAKPEGAQRTLLIAALKAIDPALVADEGKAISNSRNQCSTLTGGGANPDHAAAVRFNTTDAQGALINAALRTTLCPKT